MTPLMLKGKTHTTGFCAFRGLPAYLGDATCAACDVRQMQAFCTLQVNAPHYLACMPIRLLPDAQTHAEADMHVP